jgi:Flp pilus assembly protein TadD
MLQVLSARVRLEAALGAQDVAKQLIGDFVNTNEASIKAELGEARWSLAIGMLYSSIDRHEEAESWYRKLVKTSPQAYALLAKELAAQGRMSDAATLCLEALPSDKPGTSTAAAVLAQLLSAHQDGETLTRVLPSLTAALKSHSDDVDLLLAMAVLNVTREDQEEAIRLFRRVVELAPDHTLALNNLATLLAERESDRKEALRLINRAIDVGGRQPALLDTLGTIQLLQGDYRNARLSLQEATAGGASDQRYYLHLAAAYQLEGDELNAASVFRQVNSPAGLKTSILTPVDREMFERLRQRFPGDGVGRDSRDPAAKGLSPQAVEPCRFRSAPYHKQLRESAAQA